MLNHNPDWEKAAAIVSDAGGRIVGRTRLQKVAFLLELAGLGEGFPFEYRHYGPYSEALAESIRAALAFDLVQERELPTSWGGMYSIYDAPQRPGYAGDASRMQFAQVAAKIDSIELELAATAAFIAVVERNEHPWEETARRKPEKIEGGRLDKAKIAYQTLRSIQTPTPLPAIP